MAEIGFADIENSILRYRKYLVVNKNNTLMKKSKTQKTRTMVEIKKMVKPYLKLDLIHNRNKIKTS